MPLFEQHGLVFVHIPKNAGRSVEAALLGGAGSPDHGKRSVSNRAATFLARETNSSFAEKYLIGTLDIALAAQHLTYVEMEMLGLLPDWSFRSFAIVRNPYDRALSSVNHFAPGDWMRDPDPERRRAAFEGRLNAWLDRPLGDHNDRAHRRPQIDYVRDKTGAVAVDEVLRFENLAADFARLMTTAGGPAAELSHRGNSGRTLSHRDFYNDAAKARLEAEFGEDIEAFGYAF